MKQRKWTTQEKVVIVMEGLKERRSVAEICREHQIDYLFAESQDEIEIRVVTSR